MKLSVQDRMTITKIVPQETNLVTIVIVKDIIKKVELSQTDIKDFGIQAVGEKIAWDPAKTKDKEVTFTKAETELLKEQIEKLNKENKINIGVYDVHVKLNKG